MESNPYTLNIKKLRKALTGEGGKVCYRCGGIGLCGKPCRFLRRSSNPRRRKTPKQIAAARRSIKIARRKWMRMPTILRQKAMPARKTLAQVRREGKRIYPVGQYMMLDIGKKRRHYVYVRKTKYGWERVKAPKAVRKYETDKGMVYLTPKAGLAMTRAARRARARR